MLTATRRIIPSQIMDPRRDKEMETEGIDSETSQEYPGSEDGERGGRSIFHAPRSDVDTLNSTRSLYDTDIDYLYINDRRFCADYFLPVDEKETFRWQMFHQIWFQLLNNSYTTVPLQNPRRILDIGCGTGDWAEDIGAAYPDAEVIGTDIAPLQPTSVPQNVFFEIDDAEMEGGWNWSAPFDFIHLRSMTGAFKDWSYIYKEAYNHLEPGGWIEVLDFDGHEALHKFFMEEQVIADWYLEIMNAVRKSPHTFDMSHLEPALLEAQGFVDISADAYDVPMGAWGDNREEKNAALVFLELQLGGVEALCMRALYEYGGWDLERIEQVCREVRQVVKRVAKNPQTAEGCMVRVKVLKGRKPLPSSNAEMPIINGKGKGFLFVSELDANDGESVNTITKETSTGVEA